MKTYLFTTLRLPGLITVNMNRKSAARYAIRLLWIFAVLCSFTQNAGATNISFTGNAGYTISGHTVVISADKVTNNASGGNSGTLRMELFAFRSPFSGGISNGYRLATYTLGQLNGGKNLSGISSGSVPFTNPPDGTWNTSILVTEYSDGNWPTATYLNFQNPLNCSAGVCTVGTTPTPSQAPAPTAVPTQFTGNSAREITAETILAFNADHDTHKAKEGYMRALKLDSSYVPAHFGIGVMYEAEENWSMAIKAFQTVMLTPNSPLYAPAREELGRIKEIINLDATPGGKRQRQYNELVAQARSFLAEGKLADAARTASEARKLDSSSWQAYAVEGEVALKANLSRQAYSFYTEASKHAPSPYKERLEDVASTLQRSLAGGSTPNNTSKRTVTLANGDRYEGDFVNGQMTGKGIYTWANGGRYEGELANNRFANGKEYSANGSVVAIYVNGQKQVVAVRQQAEEAQKGYVSQGGLTYSETITAAKRKCFACHALDKKIIGPSWMDVSAKYRGDPEAISKIAANITRGGEFGWRLGRMPPKGLGANDAEIKSLSEFIAGLAGTADKTSQTISAPAINISAMPAEGKAKCGACHSINKKLVGPSWMDVSAKYRGDPEAVSKIAANITRGGEFGWRLGRMPSKGLGANDAEIKSLSEFIAGLTR